MDVGVERARRGAAEGEGGPALPAAALLEDAALPLLRHNRVGIFIAGGLAFVDLLDVAPF